MELHFPLKSTHLDETAVDSYLDRVAKDGNIDVVLNLTGPQPKDYANGTPILDLPVRNFMVPLTTLVPSQFITARSAARYMTKKHSGVIEFVTAPAAQGITPETISIGACLRCDGNARESFRPKSWILRNKGRWHPHRPHGRYKDDTVVV